MLLHIITHQPEMLVTIVQRTPLWVWGLLAALLALGASQMRQRTVGLRRVFALPLGMAAFSIFSLAAAFGSTPAPGLAAAWVLACTSLVGLGLWLRPRPPAATRYHAASRHFDLPGSAVPLLLIVALFFTRYAVNVELALQPALAREAGFALQVAALYGAFSGLFALRAARLWRLARSAHPAPARTH